MSDALLNPWERLNVHRAWMLINAWLPRGGDLQALGTLLDSVIILKNRFTDEGRTRAKDLSLDRPGYVLTKTATDLYVDIALALSLILSNLIPSPVNHEVVMVLATAGEWVLELLREACNRNLDSKRELAIRQAATRTRHFLFYCSRRMRNFPAAWMYGRAMKSNYDSATTDFIAMNGAQDEAEAEARSYASTRFGVPLREKHLPEPSPLAYHHTARMTGAALDDGVGEGIREARWILNGVDHPLFVTIGQASHSVGGIPSSNLRIWRFSPCQSRGLAAAKTLAKVRHNSLIKADMAPQIGAVFNNMLFLTCFVGPSTPSMMAYDVNPSSATKLNVLSNLKAGVFAGRTGASLVACHGMLVAFGGLTTVADLKMVFYNSVACATAIADHLPKNFHTVRTNGIPPRPRSGHSAWMIGDKMCVFGGVAYETDAEMRMNGRGGGQRRLVTLNDLWRLDVISWTWERLQPLGLQPCPRMRAGVAVRGKEVYIVGGLALPAGTADEEQLALADIWQFHPEEGCWVQVLPQEGSKAWMSARYGPACAVLDSGALAVIGGYGAESDPVGCDVCLTFNISRNDATGAILGPLSTYADGYDCVPMLAYEHLQHRFVKDISPILSSFLEAPAGCANFLSFNHSMLALAFVAQEDIAHEQDLPFIKEVFGSRIALTPDRAPLLGMQVGKCFWWPGGRPFDTVPRWLNWPNEAIINHYPRDKTVVLKGLTQTIKAFGTRKAAVEYFKMTQLSAEAFHAGWSYMEVKDVQSRNGSFIGPVTELLVCKYDKDPRQNRQLYITAVTEHYYSCWLATLAPAAQTETPLLPTLLLLLTMLRTQVSLLASLGVPVECIQCGMPEHIDAGQRRAEEVKVCRDCRLVRYCSARCQEAAWPQHKVHCAKYAKLQR